MINLSRLWQSSNALMKAGLLLLLLSGLTSCNLNNSNPSSGSTGNQITVLLHDTPVAYEGVLVNVQKVEVQNSGTSAGWQTLNSTSFSVDLLRLINGNYAVIGQDTGLASGTYDQLRLIMGTGNKVQVGGKIYDMSIDTSTVIVPIQSQIDNQQNSVIMLDFDIAKSVHLSTSDSTFTLKPVIKANELNNTGIILGQVNQSIARPLIYAVNGGDTVTSTYTDLTSGKYEFIGIPGGTYSITIHPLAGNYKDTTLTGITVTPQKSTQLSVINLPSK